MDEHSFIRAVHRHIGVDVKIWKVRDDFHGGVSDAVYFGTKGRVLFVEYKYRPLLPARDETLMFTTNVSALQLHWFRELHVREIPVAFVFGVARRALYFDSEEYVKGISKAEFKEKAVTFEQIAMRITSQLV